MILYIGSYVGKMKITIIGAGNIGTLFATHYGELGHDITVLTNNYSIISETLNVVDDEGEVIHKASNIKATGDTKEAISDADVIFVTVPSFMMAETAKNITPYVNRGQKIGLLPGTGGGEFAFHECINKGAIIFGLQRVPCVARLIKYGHTVHASGYRDKMYLASIPRGYEKELAAFIEEAFNIDTIPLENYLNITLTPSNPILHTTRLRTVFKDYYDGLSYESVPLFYEDWNDETSELLLKCDAELQEMCNMLSDFDLSYVKSLKEHYESNNADELTKKITSIRSFKGLKTPTLTLEDGSFIPDFDSRYFKADFPFGLAILVQIADFLGYDAKNMKEIGRAHV